jgi:hypothetical protein
MFSLQVSNWSFHEELQIIQADVKLEIEGQSIVEEPLCVDVGLPALLLSGLQDTEPFRFSAPESWEKMPFFVCGCGDPECRGFSFQVKHHSDTALAWIEIEESETGSRRIVDDFILPKVEVQQQLISIGEQFETFIEGKNYQPYFSDTAAVVQDLLQKLKDVVSKSL